MRGLYILGSYLYGFVLHIASLVLRHPKAKKIVEGRKATSNLEATEFPPDPIWVHVSSLGEYEQVKPILKYIKAHSKHAIVLSFYSSSGYDRVNDSSLFNTKIYLPLDVPKKMSALIDKMSPHALILSKYDIWPIMLSELEKRSVPKYLFSAHFRDSQIYFKSYGSFFLKALKSIQYIFVQNKKSAETLIDFYPSDQVAIGGDMRVSSIVSDSTHVQPIREIEKFLQGHPCFIGASIYAEEVKMILNSWPNQVEKIILAPHEITQKNIAKIEGLLRDASYTKYSDGIDYDKKILLLDTVGLLKNSYQYSKLVYVGGGFGKGIHNIIEPAVHHNRVIHGPKSQTFPEAQELNELGTAILITDRRDFRSATSTLLMLSDDEVKQANRSFFRSQQELNQKTYKFLENLDFIAS